MTNHKKILLQPKRENSLLKKHPWVFSGAIRDLPELEEGEIVSVHAASGQFLARGYYSAGTIAVRVLSFLDEECDQNYFKKTFLKALKHREQLQLTDTNAYRLFFGEADGIPGLIIDRYNDTAVVQFQVPALLKHKDLILTALADTMSSLTPNIFIKGETGEYFKGQKSNCEIIENGVRFHVDFEEGQKTGFFLDQRENRKLLQRYAKDKTVLNLFSYTGAFSVYALAGGAKSVHSVDYSKPAIELLERNIALNGFSSESTTAIDDCFDYLSTVQSNKFNCIVLDPPALAKHRKALDRAVSGYKALNRLAIEKIASGGLLFTFSCSQLLARDHFKEIVFESALRAKREVQILHQLHQAPCHPISIFHPEGEYLKGFVLRII
jgi:23S rRNA (cytosine1962-C5)-methyltransferase